MTIPWTGETPCSQLWHSSGTEGERGCSGDFEAVSQTPLHGWTGVRTDAATDFTRSGRTDSKYGVGNLKEGLGRRCMVGLEAGLGARPIPLHKWCGVGLNFSEILRDSRKMSGFFSDYKRQRSCAPKVPFVITAFKSFVLSINVLGRNISIKNDQERQIHPRVVRCLTRETNSVALSNSTTGFLVKMSTCFLVECV